MIRKITSIQELYDFIGLNRTPVLPYFDVLTHQDTYPDTYRMVPPHRRDFFSVIFLESQQTGTMHINQRTYAHEKNLLFFQSPQHVFSFVRGEAMRGFILFFKPEFLLPHCKNISDHFPHFTPTLNNVFKLSGAEKEDILLLFHQIQNERDNESLVKYLLLALLEKSKIFHQNTENIQKKQSQGLQMVHAFNRLVDNHFIEEKSVAFYAGQLYVTANYLNINIKKHTGKTAKEHIISKILLEAKNMLQFTELDSAEISHILHFNDPSYFGRFFKKHTGQTPDVFRKKR